MNDASYARISSDDGSGNSVSIHRQLQEIQTRASQDGHTIAPAFMFTDEGKSGRTLKRPAMQKLIAQIKAGKIRRLYVYELSRLSRSVRDTEDFFALCAKHNVELIPLYGFFDQSTPEGEFATGIQTQLNRYWSAKTSFSLKRYRKHAKASGIYHAHKAPMGLDRAGKFPNITWTPNADFPTVLEILNLYVSGHGSSTITVLLAQRGVTWKSGKIARKPPNPNSVNNLVKGIERYRDFLDPALYALIVAIRAERKDRHSNGRRPENGYALLRGLVVCDLCGSKYNSSHHPNETTYEWTYYHPNYIRCANPRKSIPRHWIDGIMWDKARALVEKSLTVERIQALHEAAPAKTDNALQQRQHLEARLMEYARLLADKRITEMEYDKLRAETLKTLDSLQAEIAQAEPEMDYQTIAALYGNLSALFALEDELDPQTRNQLMRLLYKQVRVLGREIVNAVIHPNLKDLVD